MKKQILIVAVLLCFSAIAFGGGIVTNTNQSATYVRMLVRDASTDIDAVYFNPAGLTKLSNGFHISLNNQFIWQNKDVTSDYELLSPTPKTFHGDVKAPFFPGVYAAWKFHRFAISFGLNPIGGGGGAEFAKGLPSFDNMIAPIVPLVQGMLYSLVDDPYGITPPTSAITGYQADIYFKGTSVFLGYQLNGSFAINSMLSISAGLRYVTAKNTYQGHIKDISVVPPAVYGAVQSPGDYLRSIADNASLGLLEATELLLYGSAIVVDAITGDVEVDAEEKGHGFTPILGLNIAVTSKLNIGLKYEFKTKMDLTQTVYDDKDGAGLFVQDSTVQSDMPAMLSVGINCNLTPKFSATAGFHYYFDKSANYGKTLDDEPSVPVSNDKVIDKNSFEIGLGLEYNITSKLAVSAGYLFAKTGVSEDYQSDLSYDLSSNSVGLGLGYKIIPNLTVNLGGSYTMYKDGTKAMLDQTGFADDYTYTLSKDALIIGIGVDFSF